MAKSSPRPMNATWPWYLPARGTFGIERPTTCGLLHSARRAITRVARIVPNPPRARSVNRGGVRTLHPTMLSFLTFHNRSSNFRAHEDGSPHRLGFRSAATGGHCAIKSVRSGDRGAHAHDPGSGAGAW